MLTVLDDYTREAVYVVVRSKMSANDVLDALYPLFINHGKPEFIISDNGPEFVATQLREVAIDNTILAALDTTNITEATAELG